MSEDHAMAEMPDVQETDVPETVGETIEPTEAAEVDEEQETQPVTEQETEAEQRKDPEYSERVQKRINKEVWRAREAERKNAELEARLAEIETKISAPKSEKPVADNFDTHEAYVEALTDWKVEEKLAENNKAMSEKEKQRAEQTALSEKEAQWTAREAEFMKTRPDYDDVIQTFREFVPKDQNSAMIVHEIINRPDGVDLVYALGKDLDMAEEIFSKPASFAARKLNNVLKQDTSPQKVALPNPPVPVSGSTTVNKSPDKMTVAEYREYRKKGGNVKLS